MYRKTIVGYDGSDEGRDALALAAVLRPAGGKVIAACVYPEGGRGTGRELQPRMADYALETLGTARRQVGADWLEVRAVPGHSPAHGLHRLCMQEEADLVAVGSWHEGEAGRVVAGSVGERLLNGTPCPVALAPKGFRDGAEVPSVVGVAYDGSDEAAAALREAAALAFDWDAAIRVVTVVPPLSAFSSGAFDAAQEGDEEIKAARRDEFGRMLEAAAGTLPDRLHAETMLVEGPPAEAIAENARDGIHLLMMGSRSYGPIRRVMAGSTAIEVMRKAPCPVIVIPRGAASQGGDAPDATAAAS